MVVIDKAEKQKVERKDMFAGIDVGTTNAKMTVYTEEGGEIAQSSCTYQRRSLHAIPPDSLWDAVQSCMADINKKLSGRDRIDALAVSSFGESVVAIDRQGRPLSDIILRTASGGGEELEAILNRIPEEVVGRITGLFPDRRFSLVRMKWYKDHTDIYERAYKFLTVEAYLIFKLTGEFYTSESTAWRTMAYDIGNFVWSESLIAAAGLDPDKLPEVLPSGSFCGVCKNTVSGAFKALEETRVYTGGHDQLCNAIGSGLRGNHILNCSGTVECISSVICRLEETEKSGLKLQQIRYPAGYGAFFSFWAPVAGCSSLDWSLRLLCSDRFSEGNKGKLHREIQRLCSRKPTGLMVAPYFNGRGFPDLCSSAYGSVMGLNFNTTPADIYQGIMESITFEDRICLEKMVPYKADSRKMNVLTSGGGANSGYWLQMKADIYGRNVIKMKHSEAGTMGAMIFAAVGEGCYNSFHRAFETCIRVKDVFYPNQEFHEMYQEKYMNYLSFRKQIRFV